MARPTKPAAERREKMIGVTCSDTEYETIRVLAFEARKTMAAFLRDLALAKAKRK